MNRDLEAQLAEMGEDYRMVVDRLVDAYRPLPAEPASREPARKTGGRVIGWTVGYLVAASLLVLVGLSVFFERPAVRVPTQAGAREYSLAYQRNADAIREMIRTQRADGSWQNDFLTRQNAAALKLCDSGEARVAYKKAMRNLRTRGML